MLTAVWVAVIVAVAFWAVLVSAAVITLMRFSRLATETSRAVAHLRERSDALIDRGHAAIDRADLQLARTDAITASMDEVTANMAELTGRVAALAPLARLIASSAGSPLAKLPAFAYGVARAVGMRRSARAGLAEADAGRSRRIPAAAPAGELPGRRPARHRSPGAAAARPGPRAAWYTRGEPPGGDGGERP